MLANFREAEAAFDASREHAEDEHDEMEALYGLAFSKVFGERPSLGSR